MAASEDAEDRVMATAQKIVKSLKTSTKETDDMLLILSSFDNRLSSISNLMSSGDSAGDSRIDPRLESAESLILRLDSMGDSQSFPWEESPDEAAEFLAAVDEILQLTEGLSIQSETEGEGVDQTETMDRAQNALQLAMSRLEQKFEHILTTNHVPLDAQKLYGSIRKAPLSFASHDGEETEDCESLGEDDEGSTYYHDRGPSLGDDSLSVDLIFPDAVPELRDIADRMIRSGPSGYARECVNIYTSVRSSALGEYMMNLDVERLSIEEVQRIEWKTLDEKMKKWIQAIKIVVKVLLYGEKRLCEDIFEDPKLISEVFARTSTGCMMQLLNFAQAVAIGKKSAEKLFRFLDMYDALSDLVPDLETLFSHEFGNRVCREAIGVLESLGEVAIGTFLEFESAVQGEHSKKPIQGGEIHPLTRYVMNYMKLVVDYSDTLNHLLGTIEEDDGNGEKYQNQNQNQDQHDNSISDSSNMSRISRRLLSLIISLESNLEEKSRLYEDNGIQYVFLMNNILYIVQKVKDSELRNVLGDQWIRKRRGQIRQYATAYLRASWSKLLSCLKDEGVGGSSSSNASKAALKERFKNFNACFEDIYRNQTAWKVPDSQLREELRISISEKVIPAYRAFMGRFGNVLESGRNSGKYIKYTPDDLESYLLDLFEGMPLVLHHLRRKST